MDFFKRKVDLEKGRKLFFECKGNGWWLRRDLDDPDEYLNCNVPKEVEAEWAKEIESKLVDEIKKEVNPSQVSSLFSDLVMLSGLSYENKVDRFLTYLDKNISKLDTFTIIVMIDTLKDLVLRYMQSNSTKSYAESHLSFYKDYMLTHAITVDQSHRENKHMKDYDFSEQNLIRRIKGL